MRLKETLLQSNLLLFPQFHVVAPHIFKQIKSIRPKRTNAYAIAVPPLLISSLKRSARFQYNHTVAL